MNQANERGFRSGHGVADRRLAACRVPTEHALPTQAHRCQAIFALAEAQARLRDLDDLRPALFIQHIRSLVKKMRESTTICAIAEEAIVDSGDFELTSDDSAFALDSVHRCHHSLACCGLSGLRSVGIKAAPYGVRLE